MIASTWDADNVTPQDRDTFINSEMQQKTIIQSGQEHLEFNVIVSSYPERASLTLPNPLPGNVRRWLGTGNTGLLLVLTGHGDP